MRGKTPLFDLDLLTRIPVLESEDAMERGNLVKRAMGIRGADIRRAVADALRHLKMYSAARSN
jgi:hypothetical protein